MSGEAITDSSGSTDTSTASASSSAGSDTSTQSSDTGSDYSASDSADASGAEGAEGSQQTAEQKTQAEKHRLRWLGRDLELTTDELKARFDDDYEWEFHGVGGKPLMRDGKPVKLKWQDIVRNAQMGTGYADAARKANEARKQYEEKLAWGKNPENRFAFLEQELGVEDAEKWLLTEAARVFQKREQMQALLQQNPAEYERVVNDDLTKKRTQRDEAAARLKQQQERQSQAAQRSQQFNHAFGGELKRIGVPMNARTMEAASHIVRDYKDAGAELPTLPELAAMVREQFHGDIFGYLDQRPDEDLLKVLGDKRRERLRKAEIAAMKAGRKVAQPTPPQQPQRAPERREPAGMTAEEFLRRGSRGRA